MNQEMANEVAKNLLASGVTIFGGYLRDVISNDVARSRDIDGYAPFRLWSLIMEAMLAVGTVEVVKHPANGYLDDADDAENSKLRFLVKRLVMPSEYSTSQIIQVDIATRLPRKLDLDVNGLLMNGDAYGNTNLYVQDSIKKQYGILDLISQIQKREFRVINDLPWRESKRICLCAQGWKQILWANNG